MVQTQKIKEVIEVALDEHDDKIPAWIVISTINDMLKKARINAFFELEQQNRYSYNKDGDGSLIRGIFNNCEKN